MAYVIAASWALNEGSGNVVAPTAGEASGAGSALAWDAFTDLTPALGRTVGADGAQRVSISSGLPSGVDEWDEFWIGGWVKPFPAGTSANRYMAALYATIGGTENFTNDWGGLGINTDGEYQWWIGPDVPPFSDTVIPEDDYTYVFMTFSRLTSTMRTYVDAVLDQELQVANAVVGPLVAMHLNGAQWMATGGSMRSWRLGSGAPTLSEIKHLMDTPVEDDSGGEPTPLDTPVVMLVGTTPESAPDEADGTVAVSWPDIDDADRYQAGIADGHDQTGGFTVVEENATSPYVFEGLERGDYTPAIRAMPADDLLLMRGSSDWGTPE